jgi:tungstate transport system ATP-binding protein
MLILNTMSDPLFRLEHITQRYGNRLALDVPLLDIRAGEALAIIGPSGAGKSTLLRLLNFLEAPASGVICYQGYTADRRV